MMVKANVGTKGPNKETGWACACERSGQVAPLSVHRHVHFHILNLGRTSSKFCLTSEKQWSVPSFKMAVHYYLQRN